MAGELQFSRRREDAHARAMARIARRQYEHRLGMAELARDRLHGGGLEPRGLEHDGERVAGETVVGEHVERDKIPSHRSCPKSVARRTCGSAARTPPERPPAASRWRRPRRYG